MTTEQQPAVSGDPWAKPAPLPYESPEEIRRIAIQGHQNLEFFSEIFDDLLKEHRGRILLIHGDQQVRIYADMFEALAAEDALSEHDRKTVVRMRLVPWWPEYE